jgi:hypothetical protein
MMRYDINMIKTVVALEPEVKQWLDQKAMKEGVPMTELVRRAVRLLQEEERSSVDILLQQSAGTWTAGDGLEYQNKMRAEWGG